MFFRSYIWLYPFYFSYYHCYLSRALLKAMLHEFNLLAIVGGVALLSASWDRLILPSPDPNLDSVGFLFIFLSFFFFLSVDQFI